MTISGIKLGDYPVVGVKWTQKLLCLENTKQNSYIKSKKKGDLINSFRLPTEAEWGILQEAD
jgi:hypothetical protein